ncbi:hypothetical protein BACT_0799 [Bifidobacterium actinocoloniiforme DSM 22766]|uniref:SPOR domain-containing protein n=1 Tax=Bifidobacterium actinocoloniiforme DSM 22766 TaxID=1437605 RepID=A0A086Z0P7_9BIFI|nr:hypothetical protein [Bifidobacterium actinocoloniiforme]AKV55306.1 hypothetical protein AB656_02600 [Bifidobacterium actinocoloniiforme DSM 22766]KFI40097.1 hypothetical protein BACT_0799 [Bifidobacterium actinocoloniiforme DSM 22766]
MVSEQKEWFFNTATGQAELGKVSPGERRMGPYPTREAALEAWKIAQERNERWEEEDRRWRNDWSDERGSKGQ